MIIPLVGNCNYNTHITRTRTHKRTRKRTHVDEHGNVLFDILHNSVIKVWNVSSVWLPVNKADGLGIVVAALFSPFLL